MGRMSKNRADGLVSNHDEHYYAGVRRSCFAAHRLGSRIKGCTSRAPNGMLVGLHTAWDYLLPGARPDGVRIYPETLSPDVRGSPLYRATAN